MKSLGIFAMSFCFNAIDQHSAKFQVIPSATLEFCVVSTILHWDLLLLHVVADVWCFHAEQRLGSSYRMMHFIILRPRNNHWWDSRFVASRVCRFVSFRHNHLIQDHAIIWPKWSWCCWRSPIWLAFPVEASKAGLETVVPRREVEPWIHLQTPWDWKPSFWNFYCKMVKMSCW